MKNQLMQHMSLIIRHYRTFSERQSKKFDIGFPEQMILTFLYQSSPVNQEAVANHYEIDKGAIAKTIRKLEEKGLIIKTQNLENRRENHISLSAKGKKLIDQMDPILKEWNDGLFQGTPDTKLIELNGILAKMSENAGKLLGKVIENG